MTYDDHQQVPPDCFPLETLEIFQSFEGQKLQGVNYFHWINPDSEAGFLYYVEFLFDTNEALLLSSGEDSTAIVVGQASELVATAARLQQLHGQAVIQRTNAGNSNLWSPLLNMVLQNINLSRHESGLYANDALQLDFGNQKVLVHLGARGGLVVSGKW